MDAEWRTFFEGFELGLSLPPKAGKGRARARRLRRCRRPVQGPGRHRTPTGCSATSRPASTPCSIPQPHFGLTDKALGLDGIAPDRSFHTGDFLGGKTLALSEILAKLRAIYCGPIGVEFTHIQDGARRRWLQERTESCGLRPAYDADTRRRFLRTLVQAEQFERFLHRTFVGAKRFSVEGGETVMNALEQLLHRAPGLKITDLVVAWPTAVASTCSSTLRQEGGASLPRVQ